MKFGPLFLGLALFALGGCAAPKSPSAAPTSPADEAVKPFLKAGHPFRIGVVQSGEYFAYNDVLVSIRQGLVELGWATPVALTDDEKVQIPKILTAWSRGSGSAVFPTDRFLDLNWTEESTPPAELKAWGAGERDLDLIVALGTLAGTMVKKLAVAGELKVPVMVESVSDPVGSKIIDSFADSGDDHITASADPDAYDRQIRLFHRVAGFQRLGLIYTDTDTGRAYAALPVVKKAASELGFSIVADTDVLEDPPNPADIPKAEDAYVKAMETLGPKVDAIYLAVQAGLTSDALPRILAVAEKYRLPTFIMEGENFVWKGALLGESSAIQTVAGLYSARKLTKILAGTSPRRLQQTNPQMPHLAVNLAEARQIGFDVPVDILLGADDVYTNFFQQPEVHR